MQLSIRMELTLMKTLSFLILDEYLDESLGRENTGGNKKCIYVVGLNFFLVAILINRV